MSLSDFYYEHREQKTQQHHDHHQSGGRGARGYSEVSNGENYSDMSSVDEAAVYQPREHNRQPASAKHAMLYGGNQNAQPQHSQALSDEKNALLEAFYNYRTNNNESQAQPQQANRHSPSPTSRSSRERSGSPTHHHQPHHSTIAGGWIRDEEEQDQRQQQPKSQKDRQWSDFFHYAKPQDAEAEEKATQEKQWEEEETEKEAQVGKSADLDKKLRSKLYQSNSATQREGSDPTAAGRYFSYRSDMEHQVDAAHYSNNSQNFGTAANPHFNHYPDTDERFYRKEEKWLEKVEHETEMLRHEQKAQEEAECTFKPHINAPYKPPAHAAATRSSSAAAKKGSHSASGQRSQSASSAHGADVGSRLHGMYKDTLDRLEEERELKEEKEIAAMPFQPNLVRANWVNHVTPRYLGHVDSLDDRDHHRRNRKDGGHYTPNSTVMSTGKALGFTPSVEVSKMLERQERECTFTPVTNSRVSPTVNHYIRTPAYKRLSAPNSRYNSPDHSGVDQDFYDHEGLNEGGNGGTAAGTFVPPGSNSFYDSPERRAPKTPQNRHQRSRSATTPQRTGRGSSSRPTTPSRQLSGAEQKAFVDRITKQYEYPIQQERRRIREMENERAVSFKPKISERSRRMATQQQAKEEGELSGRSNAPGTPGVGQRAVNRLRSLSASRTGKPQHGHESCAPVEKLNFTPKIDRRSDELREAWLKHHEEVEARRKKRLERLGEEKEFAEAKELTFRPELSESATHSKGFIKDAVQSDENFKNFLSMQRARREKDLKPHRKDLAAEEKKACTFQPTIHEAPEYIQVIAQTLALTREERDRHGRGLSPTPRTWNNSTEVLHRDAPSPRPHRDSRDRTPLVGKSSSRQPLRADRSLNTSARTPVNRSTMKR